ncbi:hypothetical protein MLD38_005396 [Melastoma candidum]|uniref:Uncharacterized protein n=1 Tax=Melastoma candidum TaxID=119954 RepID=A0ACB9RKS4_9MYRT|nr:hypothetical protein MLD38_005396 [Melastoma candidum]
MGGKWGRREELPGVFFPLEHPSPRKHRSRSVPSPLLSFGKLGDAGGYLLPFPPLDASCPLAIKKGMDLELGLNYEALGSLQSFSSGSNCRGSLKHKSLRDLLGSSDRKAGAECLSQEMGKFGLCCSCLSFVVAVTGAGPAAATG